MSLGEKKDSKNVSADQAHSRTGEKGHLTIFEYSAEVKTSRRSRGGKGKGGVDREDR